MWKILSTWFQLKNLTILLKVWARIRMLKFLLQAHNSTWQKSALLFIKLKTFYLIYELPSKLISSNNDIANLFLRCIKTLKYWRNLCVKNAILLKKKPCYSEYMWTWEIYPHLSSCQHSLTFWSSSPTLLELYIYGIKYRILVFLSS